LNIPELSADICKTQWESEPFSKIYGLLFDNLNPWYFILSKQRLVAQDRLRYIDFNHPWQTSSFPNRHFSCFTTGVLYSLFIRSFQS